MRAIALTLALVGVTVMVGAPSTDKLNPIGVILALASALLYSAYLPSLEHLQQGIPALVSTFLLVAGAAVTFVIAALFARELYLPTGVPVWSNIVVLALVSTVIAFSTLIKGLSVLGPVRTAIIATVEPFFTAMLGCGRTRKSADHHHPCGRHSHRCRSAADTMELDSPGSYRGRSEASTALYLDDEVLQITGADTRNSRSLSERPRFQIRELLPRFHR